MGQCVEPQRGTVLLVLKATFLTVITVPKQNELLHEAVGFSYRKVPREVECQRMIFCKAQRVNQMIWEVTVPPINVCSGSTTNTVNLVEFIMLLEGTGCVVSIVAAAYS